MSPESCKTTILAVDDSPANIDVVKEALSPEYLVKAAVDGKTALKIVQQKMPDLILLDILMPDVDGYEVCRLLKADPATRDIPIIFLTVKDQDADEAFGLSLGAVDYIIKPISPAILKERVRTHLSLRKAHRELKEQNEELIKAARLREDVDNITRHDLKGPLSVIIGYPDLILLNASLTAEQISYLKSIQEAGYTMLSMINTSLNLLKMEQGQYQLSPEPIDAVRVLRKILKEYESLTRRDNLKVAIVRNGRPVRDGEEFRFMGEELLAFSMFSNLIKNAVEASPSGETITIGLESGPAMNRVCIFNKGAVPAEIRERFFDKYATAGKKWGTGLGTYSARLMAETLRGSIELDTSHPDGTTVRVLLPAAGSPAEAPPSH